MPDRMRAAVRRNPLDNHGFATGRPPAAPARGSVIGLKSRGFRDDIFTARRPQPRLCHLMPFRPSTPFRILCAFGAGFAALGWGLHALTTLIIPTVDAISFRIGAVLVGVFAGAGAFGLAQFWRPRKLEREH